MSWGIADTASEIEKIKAKSADYLNGLNCYGVIDYALEACPEHLARFNDDEPNVTIEKLDE